MTRTYELGVVIEPRQSDEAAQAIIDRFTTMLEESGATIQFVDHWGKRKLAYPIRKYKEGRYYFVYVSSETAVSWVDIERLLMQDENVLRHLVVRTDHDLKRAQRGKIKPVMPWERDNQEEAAAEGGR